MGVDNGKQAHEEKSGCNRCLLFAIDVGQQTSVRRKHLLLPPATILLTTDGADMALASKSMRLG
jgi:hypothetical protein